MAPTDERQSRKAAFNFRSRLKRALEILPLAAEASSTLFLTTMAVGAFALWRSGQNGLFGYLRISYDPAMAAILLVVASVAAPSLINARRLQFPLNLTLPTAYFGLLITFKVLSDDGRALTYSMGESTRVDLAWYSVGMIGSGFVLGVVVLSMLSVISKRHRGADEPGEGQSVQ